MLRICNWISGRFGYRIMKVQTFKCSQATWTNPESDKTITVEAGQGRACGGGGGNA